MDSRQALTTKAVENRTSVPSKSRKLFYVKRLSYTSRCSVFFSDLSRAGKKVVNGQYFCNICGSSFNFVSDLDAHVSNHSMEDPYSCGLCKMPFWALSDLENHVRSHKGKKLFECEIVDLLKNLGDWSNLKIESVPDGYKEHERIFSESLDEFSTEFPEMPFLYDSESVTAEVSKDNVDEESDERISFTSAAKDRGKGTAVGDEDENAEEDLSEIFDESKDPGDVDCVQQTSSSEITNLKCKICLRVFPHLKGFMRHHDYHRDLGEYKCHICDKTFHCQAFKEHLKSHSLETSTNKQHSSLKTEIQLDSAAEGQGKNTGVAAEAEEDLSLIFDESQVINEVSCLEPRRSLEISRLQCRTCQRVFPHLKAFSKHRDYHRNKGEYKCHICDKVFHRQAFKVHMKTHYEEAFDSTTGCLDSSVFAARSDEADNGKIGIHTCHLCKVGFADLEELKQHSLSTHVKERPYICEVCGHCFTKRTYFNVHMKEHSLNKKEKCEVCGKGFTKPSRLARHFITHSIEKPFKCEICEAAYFRIDYLHRHCKTHGISRIFKCSVCGLGFDKFASLQEHRKGHVFSDQICEVCGKSFAHRYLLKVHKRIHEAKTESQCKICDKVFKGQFQLRRHMLLHSKPCSYQCDLCGHSFRNMAKLRIHRQRHAGEKPYKCKFCDRAFFCSSDVTIHERMHTGNKPYKCRICYRKFRTCQAHRDHLRTHTGEKPHSCKICGREFSFRKTMLRHVRIHTGEEPYKCQLCGSKFRICTMLKEHFTKVHPEEGPLTLESSHGVLKTLKQENKLHDVTFKMTTPEDDKFNQNNTKIKTKKRSSKKKAWISESSEEDTEPSTDEMENAVDSADTTKARTSAGDYRQTRYNLRGGEAQCENVGPREFCCGVCFKKFKTREETIVHYSQHD